MIPIHRILVPTDFSEPAHAALKWAATLAREFDSRLYLLHVVPEPYAYPWGTELSTLPLNDILAQSEEAARQRLIELAAETQLARRPGRDDARWSARRSIRCWPSSRTRRSIWWCSARTAAASSGTCCWAASPSAWCAARQCRCSPCTAESPSKRPRRRPPAATTR